MPTLIVDDDRNVRIELQKAVDGESYPASCVEEGLVLAQLYQPAVILLDVLYRGRERTGIDEIERFRRASPRSQIIVMTGQYFEDDEDRAKAAGAFAYFEKGGKLSVLRGLMLAARRLAPPRLVPLPSALLPQQ